MATSAGGRSPSRSARRQILEKVDKRTYLDDTLPLQATITTYKILQSHVEYTIQVQRGPNSENSWNVTHRYNEFSVLQQLLQISSVQLPLPPKKLFGNTDRKFLNERQEGLQAFINAVLADPLLAFSLPTKRFLDPENYPEDIQEKAFRTASMFFRSNPEYSVVEALKGIGWRCRKHYYLIASKIDPKAPRSLLSLCEPGSDHSFSEKELETLLRYLVEMKHPNILSPKSATFTGTALMVVREYCPSGSLRDKIYQKKPDQNYLTKYGTPTFHNPLTGAQVRRYGRQILDAMQFLLEKGFVLGHIHSGNVIMDRDVCRLTDIENTLLGLPHVNRYFTYMHDLRKIQSTEAEAVYYFGHMLYEMCCGHMLKTPLVPEELPANTPFDAVPVLQSLLSSAGIKNLPSISDLLAKPFFSEVAGTVPSEKPQLKVSSKLKEPLKEAREKAETRLVDYHRKVAQSRRISKAHEALMSDDKKKERRKIRRQKSEQSEEKGYPTSKLTRQSTVATSTPATSSAAAEKTNKTTKTQKSPSTAKASAAPPPPLSQPPEPRSQPPPSRSSNNRGALLGSIEGFSKAKLRKSVCLDRSAPKL